MLKQAFTFFVITLWAVAASAQESPVHVVVFTEDGGLSAGASVSLECDETQTEVTPESGELWLTAKPGPCFIVVQKDDRRGEAGFDIGDDEVEILVTLTDPVVVTVDGATVKTKKVEDVAAAMGRIKLRVTSLENAKPVKGAQIFVRGNETEAKTDEAGEATLTLPVATYDVSVVHGDYSAQTVQGLVVSADAETSKEVHLSPAAVALEDFTVTAPRIEGNAADSIDERKNSTQVAEVLGAEEMSKNGSSNAADALTRVTGITVIGGKFVYVRGLGDRYSTTLLGGANLPSPEPEKRVVPLDLFPAEMLQSVLVQKSYSADMPGEFGGGAVVLRTRDVPKEFEAKLGISTGGNSETTFQDGLDSPGGSIDFLGIDDGTRALPADVVIASEAAPLKEGDIFGNGGYTAEELEALGESLPNTWGLGTKAIPPNMGLSGTVGVPFNLGGGESGLQLGLVYDNDWETVRRQQNYYVVGSGGNLEQSNSYTFDEVTNNVVLGGILTTGWNLNDEHDIRLTTILDRVTDGEDRRYVGFNRDVDSDIRVTRFRWLERQLFFQQVDATHVIVPDRTTLKWNYAFSQARRNEPDRRETRYDLRPSGVFQLSDRPEGNSRVFSKLVDNAHSGQVAVDQVFTILNRDLTTMIGGSVTAKNRGVDTRRFKYFGDTLDPELFQQPANVIFTPENIGPGLQFTEITRPTDNYSASHYIGGGFVKLAAPIVDRVEMVAGTRFEYSDQTVETFELFSANAEKVNANLATADIMPHAGVNWTVSEKIILRGSVSRNVSRPDFRELSPQLFNDVTGGLAVQGNPELNRATIVHADSRLEWYFSETEFASVGGFYKYFNQPIESVLVPGAQQLKTFENAEAATNVGAEVEVRTGFGFIAPALRDLYAASNFGVIYSRVKIDKATGIQTSDERALQGQSPYVGNAQLGYDNVDIGTRVAVLFNIVGPRISEVGALGAPDIFEIPAPGLDVVVKQSLGEGFALGAKVKNVLNGRTVYEQGDFETSSYRKGIGASVSLSKTF